jgi:hypothetical protein
VREILAPVDGRSGLDAGCLHAFGAGDRIHRNLYVYGERGEIRQPPTVAHRGPNVLTCERAGVIGPMNPASNSTHANTG